MVHQLHMAVLSGRLLLDKVSGVEAKNFVLQLGTTDERSQWCNRLPLRKEDVREAHTYGSVGSGGDGGDDAV